MNEIALQLTPRDPLIARDGRPFGVNSGRRMRSCDWLTPSVVAGSLRTLLGKSRGGNFDQALIGQLKRIAIRGPFPFSAGQLFFPAPADLLRPVEGPLVAARPLALASGEGSDVPSGLLPVCLPHGVGNKFRDVPAWWSRQKIEAWMTTPDLPLAGFFADVEQFRNGAAKDERTHLQIDPKTLAADEGMLFSTTGLVLDRMACEKGDDENGESQFATNLAVRLRSSQALDVPESLLPLGGERRLVQVTKDRQSDWSCPAAVKASLRSAKKGQGIRMTLATPAVFSGGWRPGWIGASLTTIDDKFACEGVRLKLVGVCNSRWRAISGWSYETHGPKAIKRSTPAGGVYFFELLSDSAEPLADRWLESVSDEQQDQNDGFGLALWGIWDIAKEN